MALPWVTQVMAHNGDTKVELFKKFRFDSCFIGEEYVGSSEYEEIQQQGVQVMYIPDPHNRKYSSSLLASDMALENVQKFKIIAEGTCGSVFLYEDQPTPLIVKTVRISQVEFDGVRTSDVYKLPMPRPRNLKKKGFAHVYPMLCGVNSYREIDVQTLIKDYSWCSTIRVVENFRQSHTTSVTAPTANFTHIKADKADPRAIYFIYQKYGGPTLHEWILQNKESAGFLGDLQSIVDQVKRICLTDLQALRLTHNDLHPGNICIQPTTNPKPQAVGKHCIEHDYNVTVIDWGWCTHQSFHMSDEERSDYENQLITGWDWGHFVDSMEYSYEYESWFRQLRF